MSVDISFEKHCEMKKRNSQMGLRVMCFTTEERLDVIYISDEKMLVMRRY